MLLRELLETASTGYHRDGQDPEEWQIMEVFYSDFNPQKMTNIGDGLAWFVATEIKETFDPHLPEQAQVDEAIRCMEAAIEELQNVVAALRQEKTD